MPSAPSGDPGTSHLFGIEAIVASVPQLVFMPSAPYADPASTRLFFDPREPVPSNCPGVVSWILNGSWHRGHTGFITAPLKKAWITIVYKVCHAPTLSTACRNPLAPLDPLGDHA